jgi:hypothetical protein
MATSVKNNRSRMNGSDNGLLVMVITRAFVALMQIGLSQTGLISQALLKPRDYRHLL